MGADVYMTNASATFKVELEDVTSDQRQVGKVQELACGFAGGVGAFHAMGRVYGVRFDDATADKMVKAWRRANPWAPEYWSELEQAYMRAMRHPGTQFSAGRVVYLFDGVHLWYALPSGRVLCYPFARVEDGGVTYAKSAWKPKADAAEWPRGRLWRGLACENVTQAIAADVLRESLRKHEADGVVLHVHDEIVIECQTENASHVEAALRLAMTTPPEWAPGLPLAVETKIMQRYGK
jgi:DNA polymerase